jgi:hypothetical protein
VFVSAGDWSIPTVHPDTLLGVQLGAIIGHDKYSSDPELINGKIRQLRIVAGVRSDLLDREVGTWVGYYDSPEMEPLVVALLDAFPGAVQWLTLGRQRQGRVHGTYDKRR